MRETKDYPLGCWISGSSANFVCQRKSAAGVGTETTRKSRMRIARRFIAGFAMDSCCASQRDA